MPDYATGSRGARFEQGFSVSRAIDRRDRQPTFAALLPLLIICNAGQITVGS